MIKIDSKEFEFTFSRSSGAGGQNINKVNTKVTLHWNISQSASINSFIKDRFRKSFARYIVQEHIVKITSQKHRTQTRNIDDCIEKLHSLLTQVQKPPTRRIKTKPTRSSVKKRITTKKNKSQIKTNRKKVDY